MRVCELEGDELDYWVAKCLKLDVIGKFLADHDPESGQPTFQTEQKEEKNGYFKTHMRYFHIKNCGCSLLDEMELESILRMKKSYPDDEVDDRFRYAGHHWQCFSPVMSYHNDADYAFDLIQKEKIMMKPTENGWFASNILSNDTIYEMYGDTAIIAALRVFVAIHLGYNVTK